MRALADTVADRSVPRDVRVIASGEEAVAAARGYAASLRPGAVVRDRERQLPFEELREFARTGLLGMRVPPSHGGDGTAAQRDFFLAEFLAGACLGNALSERGGTTSRDWVTRLVRRAGGDYLLNGRKYYSTGALTAQWLPVFALDEAGEIAIAYVPRDAPGVHVDQDWNAFGQRATFSGTTVLEDVAVPAEWVVHGAMGRPQAGTFAAFGQLMHVAVDVGIARGALDDGVAFLRERARPWWEAGVDRVTEARLAVAAAKAFAGDVALEVSSAIFDFSGSSAADTEHGLDRHWRNARTHTLHDPARSKHLHLGRHAVDGVAPPPGHALI